MTLSLVHTPLLRDDFRAGLAARGKQSLQRNDEVHRQVRLDHRNGLPAARDSGHARSHRSIAGTCIDICGRRGAVMSDSSFFIRCTRTAKGRKGVSMRGQLTDLQRDIFRAAILPNHVWTETRSIAHVNRHATLQVRQGKVRRSIAAIGGAKQRKQSRILCNGQQLPITQRPALRGKVESDHQDRSKVNFHRSFPSYGCTTLREIAAVSRHTAKEAVCIIDKRKIQKRR